MSPTFADLGVPPDVVARLAADGKTSPFPVQAATLPDALAGHDVSGKAPTGSGKTLAFGIAAVLHGGSTAPRRPRVLILVPTRELAAQVERELTPLAVVRGRTVLPVYGGAGFDHQIRTLRRGVDILVATPGRLEDLIDRREVGLGDVDLVILDEADRMADMGFLPAVTRLLDATSRSRQTLLFSATLDGDVDVLVRKYQRSPRRHEVEIRLDEQGEVTHHFWNVDRAERAGLAARLVSHHGRVIVFCRTKHGADRLAKQMRTAGVDAVAIHGNRTQGQRERALAAFDRGEAQALVATDVAARGIHVDQVPCVVHFDPPADHKDYVHRSGRTGRAGEAGTVVSLVAHDQHDAITRIQRKLGMPVAVHRADDLPPVPARSASARPAPERRADTTPRRTRKGGPGSGAGHPRSRSGAPAGSAGGRGRGGHGSGGGRRGR